MSTLLVRAPYPRFVGPLDDYTSGLAAAYSLRTLLGAWRRLDGRLVRVRALGLNSEGEADVIGVGPDGALSLDSPIVNLDAVAISRGLTESHTLADLVDAGGAGYDGRVQSWYDQSGAARHASQDAAASRPAVVSAGALLVDASGKPWVEFDGVDDYLATSYLGPVGVLDIFAVAALANRTDNRLLSNRKDSQAGWGAGKHGTALVLTLYGRVSLLGDNVDEARHLIGALLDASLDASLRVDGAPAGGASFESAAIDSDVPLHIGKDGSRANFMDGSSSEILLYAADKSADRTAIEAAINNYYGIY